MTTRKARATTYPLRDDKEKGKSNGKQWRNAAVSQFEIFGSNEYSVFTGEDYESGRGTFSTAAQQ
jgi:hypothetical protein